MEKKQNSTANDSQYYFPDEQKLLNDIISHKKVIVCCGAGGVGKTSTSVALAIHAARQGKHVLVLTIDPSKRLAQTLNLKENLPHPVQLDDDILKTLGVPSEGSLSAWLLDPKKVADNVVRSLSPTPQAAENLLNNKVYMHLSQMLTGMQEYTAVESLYHYITEGRYDLIVLDTPPSRNALQFLYSPGRLGKFLDNRVFKFFIPNKQNSSDDLLTHKGIGNNFIKKLSGTIIDKVFLVIFGKQTASEISTFFTLFGNILSQLGDNAGHMKFFFTGGDASFLLVTTPQLDALKELSIFRNTTQTELGINIDGYILNKTSIVNINNNTKKKKIYPTKELFPALSENSFSQLLAWAEEEKNAIKNDLDVIQSLKQENDMDNIGHLKTSSFVIALPEVQSGVFDLDSVAILSDAFK